MHRLRGQVVSIYVDKAMKEGDELCCCSVASMGCLQLQASPRLMDVGDAAAAACARAPTDTDTAHPAQTSTLHYIYNVDFITQHHSLTTQGHRASVDA